MAEELIVDSPSTEAADADAAVDDNLVADEVEAVDPDAPAEESAEDSEEQVDETGKGDKTDGRALPKQVQQALKQFRESSPENAKIGRQLQDAFMRDQALGKTFPKGVSEALGYKTLVDSVGGQEGVANLRDRSAVLDQVDADIAAGDPGIIKSIIADSPEGFKKLVPHVLEELENLDRKAYASSVVTPVMVQGLESAGFADVMGEIKTALTNGNTQAALQRLAQIEQWYASQKNAITQSKQTQMDPERQKLAEDRKAFETDKYNGYVQSVFNDFDAHRGTLFTKAAAPYTKGMSKEAVADLKEGFVAELSRAMTADAVYAKNVRGILRQNDKAKSVSYINAKQDELYAQAFKTVYQRRYGTMPVGVKKTVAPKGVNQGRKPAPGAKPSEAVASTGASAVLVSRAFKRDELDRAKDPGGILFMTNKGYPKSGAFKGRLVTWK